MFVFVEDKTAYELRMSDWSSDVCSSDLQPAENLADALVAVPVRLKAFRAQCATDRQAVDEDDCRAAAEAFRRRFFSGQAGPDEYRTLAELPPIPASFDEPIGEDAP